MTVHDSEQVIVFSGSDSNIADSSPVRGAHSFKALGPATQMPDDTSHQVLDGFATVVPRHVRMDLAPHPLDGVMVRTVRGQEVQLEQVPVLPQGLLHPPAGVDAVVVEDQVDPPGPGMILPELREQCQEQVAVLALCLHAQQVAAVQRECSGEVALAVLSGSHHQLLLAPQHPVPADARVQVDVDLVFEVGDLAGRQVINDLEDGSQPSRLARFRPGTEHTCELQSPYELVCGLLLDKKYLYQIRRA